jgi:hypothetical protein
LKRTLLLCTSAFTLAACETPPKPAYVAQRGYLTVEPVQAASQIALITPSEQTVVRDSEPEGIRFDSWSVVPKLVEVLDDEPAPAAVSRFAFAQPEPQISVPPAKRSAKVRKQLVVHKPKPKAADCKPGEEGRS